MWKPARVVSANFLDRIADPACRFHSAYQAYQNGDISKTELIARLPHVAMVGDSACMGVYISSTWGTFWRANSRRGNNWFLDTDPTGSGIQSVSKGLEQLTPFVAIECAGIGALVDRQGQRRSFLRTILRTRNLSGQISHLLSVERFPDLVLISIGHNDVDWAWHCAPEDLDQPDNWLRQLSQYFRGNFARQVRRLMDHARMQRHRVAVVVYGLVNFESYFQGREIAERLRVDDATRYPHLETTYRYFTSFRPPYRSNLIRLAKMVNEELRAMVLEPDRELTDKSSVQLRYSDALATADLSRAELLHPIDGWHASVEGHSVLARAAFRDLEPSLEFLGFK
jgi:lysophospholipase L1-like esterase